MWSPLSLQPVSETPRWHPEPLARGTFSILSTCLFTISICTWTAVHLNIPAHGKAGMPHVWRKVGWLIIGLIAPEITYVAARQFFAARELHRDLTPCLELLSPPIPKRPKFWKRLSVSFGLKVGDGVGSPQDDTAVEIESSASQSTGNTQRRRHRWTMTHTNYALMGGFVFQDTGKQSRVSGIKLPDDHERLTLTPAGVRFLAEEEPNLLPDLSEAYIKDKGKITWFSKSLVLGQALWFCFQCITRLAQGLAITLLELNTFAHVLYAFFVYMLWWHKPLDIEVPTEIGIEGEKARDICAAMCTSSNMGHEVRCVEASESTVNGLSSSNGESPTSDIGAQQLGTAPNPPVANSRPEESTGPESRRGRKIKGEASELYGGISSDPQEMVINFGEQEEGIVFRHVYKSPPPISPLGTVKWVISQTKQSLLENEGPFITDLDTLAGLQVKLSAQTVSMFSAAKMGFAKYSAFQSGKGATDRTEYLHIRSKNHGLGDLSKQDVGLLYSMVLAGCVYGGLHLLAWEGSFRTRAELMLWRISSITITGPLGLVGVMVGIVIGLIPIVLLLEPIMLLVWYLCLSQDQKESIKQKFRQLREKAKTGDAKKPLVSAYIVSSILFTVVILAYMGLYMFARVYVVVECFVSLAYAPEGAFQVPSWSRYFPHVS